jgi:esterase/lipase superfamily enzyme
VFAQTGYEDIEAATQEIVVLAPELGEDVFAPKDLVLMLEEIDKQLGLAGREDDVAMMVDGEPERILVELDVAAADERPGARLRGGGAADDVLIIRGPRI